MSGTQQIGGQNLKLKFEVERVENVRVKKRIGRRATDGITKGLIFEEAEYTLPNAFMVYFPSGHSLLVETEQELIRLGFMDPPGIVDMETGEEVPVVDTYSPKEMVKRATQHRSRM
jgi:hypothetical protein